MEKRMLSIFLACLFALVSVSLAEAMPVITDGLVAAYEFSGNADDSMGTNHGTVEGAVLTADRSGNQNSAYSFDGIDDHIEISPIFSSDQDPLTYTSWIKIAADGWGSIYGEFTYSGMTRNFFAAHHEGDGSLFFDQYDPSGGAALIDVDLDSRVGEWVHVALTKDNDWVSAYMNGVLIGSVSHTETYAGSVPTVAGIGGRYQSGNWTNGSAFSGSIDEFYIYDRALSGTEIGEIYASTAPVPEPATMLLLGSGLAGLAGLRRKWATGGRGQ